MLNRSNLVLKLYYALYGLVFFLLVIPWATYEKKTASYLFLPRRVVFVLIGLCSLVIILKSTFTRRQIAAGILFSGLGVLHMKVNQYFEPHYFLQFFHLEIALLIAFAPLVVKEKMLKYSSYILYILLAKALYFNIGRFVHGGFFSSNLYATYIVYFCFIEVYRKRYWSLLPAIIVIYFVGSKACFLSFAVLILFAIVSYFETHPYLLKLQLFASKIRISRHFNIFVPLVFSAIAILVFTKVMVQSDYYKNWVNQMAPSKAESTENNMIMYGLVEKDSETESKRMVLQKTKDMQFNDVKIAVTAPLITDIGMSVALRLTQYDYVYNNILQFFWVGNAVEAQKEMFGHNPHTAVLDFIFRLGVVALALMFFFYLDLFKFMNLFFLNVGLVPILAFQPYGFTIGHSIIVLTLTFALAQTAKLKT